MKNSVRLRHHTFDGLREIGGFGQPLHVLYPQIRTVLASEIGSDAGHLLAEPMVDRTNNRIEWYGESDPDEKPVSVSELPEEERRSVIADINSLMERGRELAERYAGSDDARKAQLGAILQAVLVPPAETDLFLVEGKPVITGWGFIPDRPWDAPGPSPDRPAAVSEPAGSLRDVAIPAVGQPIESARDVAVPDVIIPDVMTPAAEPTPATQSVIESAQSAQSSPPPLEPALEQPSPELPKQPARGNKKPVSAPSSPSTVEKSAPAPMATTPGSKDQAPSSTAPLSLRYVVVGSRYFWGVAIIALLLLLFAAYWALGRTRSPEVIADRGAAVVTGDGKLTEALHRAQQTEAALRTRLEQLQIELAGRRGQCRLPQDGATSEAPTPIPGQVASTSGRAADPAVHGQSLPAVVGNVEGPATGPAAHDVAAGSPIVASKSSITGTSLTPRPGEPTTADVNQNRAVRLDTASEAGGKERPNITSIQVSGGSPSETVSAAPSARDATLSTIGVTTGSGTRSANSGAVSSTDMPRSAPSPTNGSSVKPVNPTNSPGDVPTDASVSPTADAPTPSASVIAPSARTGSPPVSAGPPATAGSDRAGRSLEEALTGKPSAVPSTSPAVQPTAERPVKTEPTAEERREFDKRMSATGASSGEITATLLWNSRGDLDLVVRCPSGRQMDFRNPAECGGSLDVDANIARGQLTDRPVENAFWPAGKAEPGNYEILVRYVPRKDEERPQDTPFQVRLSRGGQESVYKGTVRPNTLVPITAFTVQR